MDQQPELSAAEFFALGNAAAAHTAQLERENAAARQEPSDEAGD